MQQAWDVKLESAVFSVDELRPVLMFSGNVLKPAEPLTRVLQKSAGLVVVLHVSDEADLIKESDGSGSGSWDVWSSKAGHRLNCSWFYSISKELRTKETGHSISPTATQQRCKGSQPFMAGLVELDGRASTPEWRRAQRECKHESIEDEKNETYHSFPFKEKVVVMDHACAGQNLIRILRRKGVV